MKLPVDDIETFPRVPLKGHISALRKGDEKHYWRVEQLIKESKLLIPFSVSVNELIEGLGNGTWFGGHQKPTIRGIVSHIERAMKADLSFPIILSASGQIMDGTHRLIGAKFKEKNTILAVQFTTDPTPEYIELLVENKT